MKHKKSEQTLSEAWNQIQTVLTRHNAPEEVKRSARTDAVGWNYDDEKLYLFCRKELYEWLEIPPAPDVESNLRFIKPILWPVMQKYNLKDLCYRIIEIQITIKH